MAPFRYDDKNVVITGASTGMGAETTAMLLDAGASVYAVDIAGVDQPVNRYVRCDLGDPASITAAAAELPSRIDVLMNCAGIPGKTRFSDLQVLQVNFLGLRMLTETLMPRMSKGSAVVHIASIAGGRWFEHVPQIAELVSTPDFAAGSAWIEANTLPNDAYSFSKELVQFYTMVRSVTSIKQGVRINSICPGVTDTKIMPDFRAAMGDWAINMTADVGIGRLAEPREMAPAMIFLGSNEASYVNGINMVVDGGFSAAAATGQVDFAKYMPSAVSTTHFVDTASLRVHYRHAGERGRPAVLLVHGFPQDSYMWRHQIDVLAQEYDVYAPDTRGYGLTDKPRIRVTRDILADDMVEFLDAVGLDQVYLVGHDWGGIIAFKAAIDHPDRFVKLALIDTLTSVWSPRGIHGWWFKCEPQADEFWPRHAVEFIRAVFSGQKGSYGPPPYSPWARADDDDRAAGARLWDPTLTWTPADVDHYVEMFDNDASWFHAVEYYRHTLPFHRLRDDGTFEFLSNPKVAALWERNEFEHMVYTPEDWHKTYPHPALWLFSPFLIPQAFASGMPADDYQPTGDLYAESFPRHFPDLHVRGARCGHFVPEEDPVRTNEVLTDFFAARI